MAFTELPQGLLCIRQAQNNKAAKVPPTCLRKSSFGRRQTALHVTASRLRVVGQVCSVVHPHALLIVAVFQHMLFCVSISGKQDCGLGST